MTNIITMNLKAAHEDYENAVCGCAVLGYIAITQAYSALDMLEENRPDLLRGELKRYRNNLVGRSDYDRGELGKLRANIRSHFSGAEGNAWSADLGVSAYNYIEKNIEQLQYAIANYLGRFPKVSDRNICASLIVAQSLASEAALFAKRRAESLRFYTITNDNMGKIRASDAILRMDASGVDKNLREMCEALLMSALPAGTDVLDDPSVRLGVEVVINKISDPKLWAYAISKAEEYQKQYKNG